MLLIVQRSTKTYEVSYDFFPPKSDLYNKYAETILYCFDILLYDQLLALKWL